MCNVYGFLDDARSIENWEILHMTQFGLNEKKSATATVHSY